MCIPAVSELRFVAVDQDDPLAEPLLAELALEYAGRYRAPVAAVSKWLRTYPAGEFAAPGGAMLIGLRDGQPVTGAKVSFNYTMDMPGMRIEQSEAKEVGNGLYQGTARFTMGGPWGLVVQIERPGMPAAREKFTVRVNG